MTPELQAAVKSRMDEVIAQAIVTPPYTAPENNPAPARQKGNGADLSRLQAEKLVSRTNTKRGERGGSTGAEAGENECDPVKGGRDTRDRSGHGVFAGFAVSRPLGPGSGHSGQNTPAADVELIGKPGGEDETALPYFALVHRRAEGYSGPGVHYVAQAMQKQDGALIVTGHKPPQWLCSPLQVAAYTRDAQQSEWGRLLVFPDRDGHVHRWAMPMSLLAGDGQELRAALLREGVTLTTNRALRPLLGTYLQRAVPGVVARCVTRTGWHGDAYALPRETWGDTPSEPVLFQAERLDSVNLGRAGDLAHWRESVALPCAGSSRLVLALSMALAGPCIGLVHAEGGGVHLRGPSSSCKSTALAVAASVYGPPNAYAQTWRATDNGLEGAAALHSDMLLVLDELGQLEPRHAGQVAYLLANGQGKQRSHRDGTPRAAATWRVLFLSAGEVALSDLVTQAGGKVRAGQEVRVIDLPADAGAGLGLFDHVPAGTTPGVFADGLKTAAAKQHGTALPALLGKLTADPDKHRAMLQKARASIVAELVEPGASGQVLRVADRFALIAAAGELATAFEITGWQAGEAKAAAAACFAAWLAARGTAGNAEPAAMLAQVRAFLEANDEARFTPWEASMNMPRTVNRAGYRKDGAGGPTFYVEREAFRREVCKGFDPAAVAQVLAEVGALLREGPNLARKERLPNGRRARVYVITPKLWEGEA